MIEADGKTKEFQMTSKSKEVYQILIYDGEGYNEAKFKYDKYKNSVIFEEAPAKGSMIMISFKASNGGLKG